MSATLSMKTGNSNSLEIFVGSIKNTFNPNDIFKIIIKYLWYIRNKQKKEGKLLFDKMKSWEDKFIQVQDKGSIFVVWNSDNYVEKLINRSFFDKLDCDPGSEFQQKERDWIEQ